MSGTARRNMRLCHTCGSQDVAQIGTCKVCREVVCEHCGNLQITHGVSYAIHNSCMRKDDGAGFSMIKFVK